MIDPRAEDSYRHGAELLTSGSPRDALTYFKAAVDLASENGQAERATARYLSYYGLCLFRTRSGYREALGYCRKAVALDDSGWPEVVGTISGDDTIFVATATQQQQTLLVARLEQLFPGARGQGTT